MKDEVFVIPQVRNTFVFLLSCSTLLWILITILAIVHSTKYHLLGYLGDLPFTLVVMFFATYSVRVAKSKIIVGKDSITFVFVHSKEISLPIGDVVSFEFSKGRFGVGTFVTAKLRDGKTVRSGVCPWQNIVQAPKTESVTNFMVKLNSALAARRAN